ncbi:hypothetical protein ABZ490_50975 [Streptomyces sp. NPDC005811]|uniref:hypothetical protein n=1 Tax=Streptomyces sp. NPDC005811 TaxID=3154565 RepID=UPI0033CC4718
MSAGPCGPERRSATKPTVTGRTATEPTIRCRARPETPTTPASALLLPRAVRARQP